MSSLPQDIITKILSRLPVKSLLRFKCVSKPWLALIDDPNFVKMHLHQATQNNNNNLMIFDTSSDYDEIHLYSIEYDSSFSEAVKIDHPRKIPYTNLFGIPGSCNGLFYIHTVHYDAIWNPCTKEHRKLPATQFSNGGLYSLNGFGYDPTIDDYKVVRIVQLHNDAFEDIGSEVKVYTLGTNLWRKIENINYNLCSETALLVDESLIWLAWKDVMLMTKSIVSFHLGDEVFCEVPYPESVDYIICVGFLEGQLCILNEFNDVQADVWVMKDYGVKESWTKLLTISLPIEIQLPKYMRVIQSYTHLKILCFTKTGKILLEYDHKNLLSYDPKHEEIEILQTRGIPCRFTTKTYVGSLVSLRSGTYLGQRQKKRKRRRNDISDEGNVPLVQ